MNGVILRKIILFVFLGHFFAGLAVRYDFLALPVFSWIGVFNLFSVFVFLLLYINYRNRPIKTDSFSFHAPLLVYFLFCIPSLIINLNIRGIAGLLTKFTSLASVFYLSVFFFKNTSSFILIKTIAYIFIIFTILGIYHAITIGFNFENARDLQELHEFSFGVFEYAHSAVIFISVLFPIYYWLLRIRLLKRWHYFVAFIGLPISIFFSGARIGIVVFSISIVLSLYVSIKKNIFFRVFTSFLTSIVIVFIVFYWRNMLYETDDYINEFIYKNLDPKWLNTSYSYDSIHSRVKTWNYMLSELNTDLKFRFGLGYHKWDDEYAPYAIISSSTQSDYFTVLFESGLFGLLGLIFYRLFLIGWSIKNKLNYAAVSFISFSLSGFTENADGYATTSWLLPIILALSIHLKKSEILIKNNISNNENINHSKR